MDMLNTHPSCYESVSTGCEGPITSLKVLRAESRAPAWVKGAGVHWTQILLLKDKAGKPLAMIFHWSQKVGMVSQGQSWIPPRVDEALVFLTAELFLILSLISYSFSGCITFRH